MKAIVRSSRGREKFVIVIDRNDNIGDFPSDRQWHPICQIVTVIRNGKLIEKCSKISVCLDP